MYQIFKGTESQNFGFRGRGVCCKIVSMYSPTSSSMIYYTERHQIHQYQVSCTHENRQAHFTKVGMLKCSHASLPEQVNFFALNSWTQRAGLMPKGKGQSCAESVELPGRTGVQSGEEGLVPHCACE